MTKKPETKDEAPESVPLTLEALLTSPGFERNCEILLSVEPVGLTDKKLRAAITSLVVSGSVKRAESKQRASATNTDNAKAKRKGVTRRDLEIYRDQHVITHTHARGWVKAACLQFGVTENTIRARLKENK